MTIFTSYLKAVTWRKKLVTGTEIISESTNEK